jgi:hypothetical protein
MTILCKKFFPNELAALQNSLISLGFRSNPGLRRADTYADDPEAEEEEDETQREESEEEDEDIRGSSSYGLDIDDKWDDGVTLVDDDRRRLSTPGVAATR